MRRALRAGTGAGAGAVLCVLAIGGCGAGAGGGAGPDAKPADRATAAAPELSRAVITVAPGDGAKDVPAGGPLAVTVADGTLSGVTAQAADGTPLNGTLSADRRSWHPAGRLALATQYTVDALAVDPQGRTAAKHAVFTTVVPQHTVIGFFTPEEGATVGDGMIVTLRFNRPVADRAAVERGVTVGAEPAATVVGHWFGDQRLDLRPADYWQPGTRVTLRLRLRDVEAAPGVYGTQSKDVHFTIGRDQRSTVDAAAHTMTVRRGGRVVRSLDVSTGAPGHTTYNGVMVIAEKFPVTRMDSRTVGFGGEYDIPDVPHAMRLTRSGTFVHGNYWSDPAVFGRTNVSHGCVGLLDTKGGGPDTPAGWFFTHSLIGDPIRVVNSHDTTVAPDNGMSGWNLTWQQWTAGSAL
ncbi:L,D-transpeptidase [Actinacidiphila paucisporea]|uniref:Lipoprotein-anchoring transpeptidase ErfK/SrfK n=1 Tax=Actinacidiphila paucisporea TaxID=310782 RepID=A0A1M7QTI6_9ACTN|nr:Ig-like domain-containing protein [Actinacidiphila paucisporea]SHN35058.1 Lipoprotein-anchoring transpeptidase ErfK/SrfK [Actinacidiphila paucisporea]